MRDGKRHRQHGRLRQNPDGARAKSEARDTPVVGAAASGIRMLGRLHVAYGGGSHRLHAALARCESVRRDADAKEHRDNNCSEAATMRGHDSDRPSARSMKLQTQSRDSVSPGMIRLLCRIAGEINGWAAHGGSDLAQPLRVENAGERSQQLNYFYSRPANKADRSLSN